MATLCHAVMRCTCSVDSPQDTSILTCTNLNHGQGQESPIASTHARTGPGHTTCETLAVNESGDARNHNPGLMSVSGWR